MGKWVSGEKFLRLWMPLFGYMAFMWYLSSRPTDKLPSLFVFPLSDKIFHIVEYFIFGYLSARVILGAEKTKTKLSLSGMVLLASLVWGIIDEIHQSFVPTREACFFDLIADCIGGGIGAIIVKRAE